MQNFTQNEPLTMTLPNSQVPNSTFGTTKNPIMTFSFHKFLTKRAKVIGFKANFVLRILFSINNDFSQINLVKFHMNIGVKPSDSIKMERFKY